MRIVALGDGYFDPSKKEKGGQALLLLASFQDMALEIAMPIFFTVDGDDGTDRLAQGLRSFPIPELVEIWGIVHAGFNFVDPELLFRLTGIPVIVFQRKLPDMAAVYGALERHLEVWKERWKRLSSVSELVPITLNGERAYARVCGIDLSRATRVLERQCLVSSVPEQLRVTRELARGLGRLFELGLGGSLPAHGTGS